MSAAALTNIIDYANFAAGYLVVAVAVVADCVAGPVGFAVPAAVVAAGSAVADFDSGFADVVGLAVAVVVGSVGLADFAVDY